MGSDTSGWTVIGRAKKNCLICVNCRQIQDRRRARHQEERTRASLGALAEVRYQRFLRGLIQPLLHHIDNHDGCPFSFQADEESNQGFRCCSPLIDEPCQSLINPQFESRIGVESGCSYCAAIFQPLQAQKDGVGQNLGQAQSQPRLAAPQRADDVRDGSDVAELKPLPAPRPGKIECDVELGRPPQQARKFSGAGQLTSGEVRPKTPDLVHRIHELANFAFECRFVSSQCELQTFVVTFQHSRHLGKAKTQRTEGHNLISSNHLVGTIEPVSGRRAGWSEQASLLIKTQGFGRDAKPPGRF